MTEIKEFGIIRRKKCIRNKNVVGRDRLPFSSNLRNLRFQIRDLG